MLQSHEKLNEALLVKTKDGSFKLWKDGRFEDLPSEEVMVRQEEIVVHTPTAMVEEKPTANFYFSVDDEEDVRQHQSKAKVSNQKVKEYIENLASFIIKSSNIDNTKISNNLRNIIISLLREVRSIAETKEALLKSAVIGGAGLTKEEAERVVVWAEKERNKAEEAIRGGKLDVLPTEKDNQVDMRDEAQKIEQDVKKTQKIVEANEIQYQKEERELLHQTIGAVEELALMTLSDFRKLGDNPTEAADRIWDKINLLEDESLIKKNEGIKAWQKSETGRLYLVMGAESMAQNITVKAVSEKRKETGKPYLTSEEFDAIADLNRKLAY